MKKYDIAVIGGGPAGYVAAIKGAQLGGAVVLFEKDVVGGTCLNRGCIPTKTYLKTAEYLHNIRRAGERGIKLSTAGLAVDMEAVVANKNKVVKQLTSGVAGLLKSYSVEVVQGTASLTAAGKIACNGKVYDAQNVILCGGSRAGILPIPGAKGNPNVLTSDGILDLTTLPKKLTIIGGGVIGCEMASAFRAFGSEVTIVELTDQLVPALDTDISAELKKALESQGVRVLTGKKVSKIGARGRAAAVFLEGEAEPILATKVLLSTGRFSDLECLGELTDKINVERGKVIVDDAMRTNLPHIYAAGDINGRFMLAHAAFKMGEVAAANAMGHSETCDLRHVPGCLYTLPEAASVGMSETEARKSHDVAVGRFPLRANGRALASGEPDGFIKVVIDKAYGEILGVHMIGGAATEMIAEPTVMMAMEITAHEAAEIIHAHPTHAEAFMEACADALGRCIHLPPKKQ
ncbi:MAG: dihydrolipoyl dehydrogenase [Oscillospiraceae bacterium]|nr:dihydrolipoyl dehydrogenase [Oscillospiraceae bacterium]